MISKYEQFTLSYVIFNCARIDNLMKIELTTLIRLTFKSNPHNEIVGKVTQDIVQTILFL